MSGSMEGSEIRLILDGVKAKSREEKVRAIEELKLHLQSYMRQWPAERFAKYYNDVGKKMFELVCSTDPSTRIGGVLGIKLLVEEDAGDLNVTKPTRFSNYLHHVIPCNDLETMKLAADCMGKMAAPGAQYTSTLVEAEVRRSLEFLQSNNEGKKHGAVLVLNSFAKHSPTLLFPYMSQILDMIWTALRDPKEYIRVDAFQALSECLIIIYERDNALRKQWFNKVLSEARIGLKINTPDAIHGSLLTYRGLLKNAGLFMKDKFDTLCEMILQYKDHKDSLIRRTVMIMLPDLAKYNPSEFSKAYIHKTMLHLLCQLKKDREKQYAFKSIGDIAVSVRSNMAPYLDAILENARESLLVKSRCKREQEAAIFECIGKLAETVGQALAKHISGDVLTLVLGCALSEDLYMCLKKLVANIPVLAPQIQDQLLNILSYTLSGAPFRLPGSPNSTQLMNSVAAREYRESMISKESNGNDTMTENQLVTLALRILGGFTFKHSLSEFVRYCAITYIEDEDPSVRREAALTSCCLYLNDPICFQISAYSLKAVGEVIVKLLTVAVTDPVSQIRLDILKSLHTKLDPHLSQADNVRLLLIALNDESFAIREVSIQIIGRLTRINPAYVVPSLRKTLIQLLTELEYSEVLQNKEESAKLLSLLISTSKTLVRGYAKPIVKVLIPKSQEKEGRVGTNCLSALGELTKIGREDIFPYIPQIMELILETFADSTISPLKRDAALKTLSNLTSTTGYVIDPLIDHPSLLNLLVGILKSEQNASTRREVVKVLGILGALDPYKLHEVEHSKEDASIKYDAIPTDLALMIQGTSPSSEDYNPTVVSTLLLGLLKDTGQAALHNSVLQAIVYIFKSLGIRCVPFLTTIMPGILMHVQVCQPSNAEFAFQQLASLIVIVKQHIRIYLDGIFEVIDKMFSQTALQSTLLTVIEAISRSLQGEFKIYLPRILPLLLGLIEKDKAHAGVASTKVLRSFVIFGSAIEEYVHLIIPNIVRMFEFPNANIRRTAIESVGKMCGKVNFTDMASRVIHPLLRVFSSPSLCNEDIKRVGMSTLCSLCFQIGSDFTVFIPMINTVIVKQGFQSPTYDQLVTKLLNGEPFPSILNPDDGYVDRAETDVSADAPSKKLPMNQQHIKQAWDTSQCSTKDDWNEWFKRLSVELLRESPSHSLRSCAGLASVSANVARELFNASFYSCFEELYDQYMDDFIKNMEIALMAPNIPPEILQILLNLGEFMEHDDKPLPIELDSFARYAQRCHAYAKCLHYTEMEFMREPATGTVEQLININNQLQQTDAAIGILKYAQDNHELELKETWYEKLQRWDDALEAYNRREANDSDSMDIIMGKMRCLHALGEWDLLEDLALEKWTNSNTETRRAIAPLAAAASWGLGQWEKMDTYISVMKSDSPDRAFFNAILCIHRNAFDLAQKQILRARDLLVTELTALVSESYTRAYGVVVRVQMLSELEEIIQYKNLPREAFDEQKFMRQTWEKRLKGCQRNVDIWQRMLKVRALVVKPKQDMEIWIKFANLCRKSGRLGLAEKALNSLLLEDNGSVSRAPPAVVYAQLKYMWSAGNNDEALDHLFEFTNKMIGDLGLRHDDLITQELPREIPGTKEDATPFLKQLARCFLKQGEWQVALHQDDWREHSPDDILGSYLLATHFDPEWYKAWHNWALANFQVIAFLENPDSDRATAISSVSDDPVYQDRPVSIFSPEHIVQYVVPAITGFFYSIKYCKRSALQDILRLLTLWFRYGSVAETNQAVNNGIPLLDVNHWLDVIPQLITRIYQPNDNVNKTLHNLLVRLGEVHPQALLNPLFVAISSKSVSRRQAATAIVNKMRVHCAELVQQSELVKKELMRVAVLWHEQWHEGLEDASRYFFGEHNIEKMFATLEPLHTLLERGPETLREMSFQTAFGRDLHDAHEWIWNYKRSNDMTHLNQAWDIYYNVFRRISRQLPQLTSLELQYVSPKLLEARNLEVAVPGTYSPGKPIIRIGKFDPVFSVISSKQRPRKLTIAGMDGKSYDYALKGHEDIRQDNLVMQLFGLVNTLLVQDAECFKRHLNITKYPAIPLSPKTGLLGWVPHSDTFHVLIREYREQRKILLNIEHRIMLQMAPDYDNLTQLQKVEVFTHALDNTRGQDLYRVLWLKSRSSEAWLERRTNYTRSLATMSMVGYILGLGDRHPSNLMLDRYSGKVIHIDFGDCFEAAILREKYPEKVPFRLTRMLTYAMEVSGIEGSYRITCEYVMRVLRDNKESLLAILEAFAYDPLINWGFDIPTKLDPVGARKRDDESRKHQLGKPEDQALTQKPQHILTDDNDDGTPTEQEEKARIRRNRAEYVLSRISKKLAGNDFERSYDLDVPTQVERLITQATSIDNLCQHYIGWCSFW
ncbi:FAT-domain-containing protein [Nadsonia fulvescens var. elongata DSM 6958]|uniref:Serine/threonine-protein kinase TOR n=1 Tax=Nadsonia fulvescens var. elongata DSM 6958 TaxID=857566 RepID=A0A1E3PD23_9ASCO|nr:FAT-domain-containing protein [Nadsonia fulvescens var. elongata DSM 6958]